MIYIAISVLSKTLPAFASTYFLLSPAEIPLTIKLLLNLTQHAEGSVRLISTTASGATGDK
jgi:hypothetical protein